MRDALLKLLDEELGTAEETRPRLPEHAFLVAYLARAIQDYLLDRRKRRKGDNSFRVTVLDAGQRHRVKRWLFSQAFTAHDVLSFPWVCEHLCIDADHLRAFLLRAKADPKLAAAVYHRIACLQPRGGAR